MRIQQKKIEQNNMLEVSFSWYDFISNPISYIGNKLLPKCKVGNNNNCCIEGHIIKEFFGNFVVNSTV